MIVMELVDVCMYVCACSCMAELGFFVCCVEFFCWKGRYVEYHDALEKCKSVF